MNKAKERYKKILFDKVQIGSKRSQTVDKIRKDMKKQREEYYEKMLNNLIEINENITKTKSKKYENLQQKKLKLNESSIKINKSDEDLKIESNIEKLLTEREKRVENNLKVLKEKYDLNVLIKKEKQSLALKDQIEKREFQNRLMLLNKSKIISKHLETTKAIDLKRDHLNKYLQQIREKEYNFSENFAKNKTQIARNLHDVEKNKSFFTEL